MSMLSMSRMRKYLTSKIVMLIKLMKNDVLSNKRNQSKNLMQIQSDPSAASTIEYFTWTMGFSVIFVTTEIRVIAKWTMSFQFQKSDR